MAIFPIIGEYRGILMVLETIVVIIFLEFSLYFFFKYSQKKKKSIPTYVELNWGIIFLSFSLGAYIFIIEEFFYVYRPLFLIIAYLCFSIGGIIFSYRTETSKELKTKYFFTIFSSFVSSVILILFIMMPEILQVFAALMAVPAYALLLLYFSIAIKKIWVRYKLSSVVFLTGIIFWLIGFAFTSGIALEFFQTLFIRVIGNILIIMGTIALGFFITTLPSLDEIGWKDKIKYIIITTSSGKCLYNENIKEKKNINEVLLGGYLSGLQIFIKTTMKDQSSLQSLSKEKEAFLIEEGKNILAIMIVEQKLEILKYYLKKIVEKFEDFFSEVFKDWKGDASIFKPTKYLIKELIQFEED
ncbi:MAG: hypothetical protein EAX96_02030 [Candidatus Lokiarchaeota archaeon]|nr:hypothetical protein [Candidatus Lokiarchaeota archaeon]